MDTSDNRRLDLRADDSGVFLPVKAQPSAKAEGVRGYHAGQLRLAVTAPPDKGRANAALIRWLATTFQVPLAAVTLSRGETSREKVFHLAGMTEALVRERLAAVDRSS